MGLDGISVNQLRFAQESNSAELNAQNSLSAKKTNKAVDGLSEGRVIDPDEEKKHENSQSEDNNENEHDDKEEKPTEPVIKYDLSQTDKYSIKADGETNAITIVETKTNKVIQVLDSEALSRFVNFLADAKGSIINRKY